MSIPEIISKTRSVFNSGRTKSLKWRQDQLKNLMRLFDENESKMCEALGSDLRKPKQECFSFEIEYIRNDIRGCLNNVEEWVKDKNVEPNVVTLMDKTYLTMDPYGVVLLIGAWNYPIQLTLGPLGGAICAGNCVVIKPSDLTPATSKLLAELVPQYLDKDCFPVVEGGVKETTELLKERFDYIFYTGSSTVGRIIREAANKHLTPVTLELGGKSPVFIDSSCNMEITAKRLLWAKCANLGQTCVAPDYVLCDEKVEKQFVSAMDKLITEWYGTNPQKSSDLARICNPRHFSRLKGLLDSSSGEVVVGGESDLDDLYISPTIIINVSKEDSIMKEEIFGPILPIYRVKDTQEAIDFINSREKPLALYVFSSKSSVLEAFKRGTSSGSLSANDAMVHMSVETLPFGGVGHSGMGAYHGKYTFETFSHQKSVLVRDFSAIGEKLGDARYPPYADWKISRLGFLLKNRDIPLKKIFTLLSYLSVFLFGVSVPFLYQWIVKELA